MLDIDSKGRRPDSQARRALFCDQENLACRHISIIALHSTKKYIWRAAVSAFWMHTLLTQPGMTKAALLLQTSPALSLG